MSAPPTVPPTSAQVEVVRRLDDAAPWLAELVLTTPVGGRGRVDLPAGAPTPDRELLRVCVAALAHWSRTAPPAPPSGSARSPRRRPWHRSFVVAGDSPHAEAVRRALAAAGRVEGGRRPEVLVVGGSLEAMVAGRWRGRVDRGAGLRWRRVWGELAARDVLPGSLDLVALAEQWAARAGADHVRVVLAASTRDAVRGAGELLGTPLDGDGADRAHPVDTDLLRLLNQALATAPDAARRRWVDGDLSRFVSRPWTPGLGVPTAQLGWAVGRGRTMAERLGSGRWRVHGDPGVVVPSTDAGLPRSVPPGRTLAVALDVLRSLEGGRSWPGR